MIMWHKEPGCELEPLFCGTAFCRTCKVLVCHLAEMEKALRNASKWDQNSDKWYNLGAGICGILQALEDEGHDCMAGVLFVGEGTRNA